MSHRTASDRHTALLEAYGEAAAALARAEERLALFPDPSILTARIRLTEQRALAWLEGEHLDHQTLALNYGSGPRAWRRWPFDFVRVFDRPLTRRGLPTSAVVHSWINGACQPDNPYPTPSDIPLSITEDRLALFDTRLQAMSPAPRLLEGSDIAVHFARLSPLPSGNVVIGTMLAERYALHGSKLSAGGIAAIGLHSGHTPWRRLLLTNPSHSEDHDNGEAHHHKIQREWLEALATGAKETCRIAISTLAWYKKVDAICLTLRRTSHLRAVCIFAARNASFSVTNAAKTLGLSRQAVNNLVTQACEQHLLRETRLTDSFRQYQISI